MRFTVNDLSVQIRENWQSTFEGRQDISRQNGVGELDSVQ